MTTDKDSSKPEPHNASAAFTLAAVAYDSVVIDNPIIKRLRERAHERMLHNWRPGYSILELNCGTGVDAVFLAQHGMHVLATDIAEGMIERTRDRIAELHLESQIETMVMPFEDLHLLTGRMFDGALSMFGGLNCAEDLPAIATSLATVLRPGAVAILSFIGKWSAWEIASSVLRGNLRKATRRLGRRPVAVNVESIGVLTCYHSVNELREIFSSAFEIERIESWSVVSPPPASLRFYRRFAALAGALFAIERRVAHVFPVNRLGDHVTIELRRR